MLKVLKYRYKGLYMLERILAKKAWFPYPTFVWVVRLRLQIQKFKADFFLYLNNESSAFLNFLVAETKYYIIFFPSRLFLY